MDQIPTPQVLEPQRVSRDDREDMTAEDHRSQSQLLGKALDQTCEYAQRLWDDLAAMRQYLHDSLPPEPAADGPAGASPHGPDDDAGWQRWVDAFATISADLCGPRGDSGYGRQSAEALARSRRQVVVPTLAHDAATETADQRTTHAPANIAQAQEDPRVESVSAPDVFRATPPPPGGSAASEDQVQSHRPRRARATAHVVASPAAYSALGGAITFLVMRKRENSRNW